jgi:hypothetical protein
VPKEKNCRYVVHRLASIVTKQLNTFSPCPRGLPATQDQLSRARSCPPTVAEQRGSRADKSMGPQPNSNCSARRCVRGRRQTCTRTGRDEPADTILAGTAVTTGLALGPPQVKLCESTVKHMAWMGYRLRSARSYLVSKAKNFSMRFQEAIKP